MFHVKHYHLYNLNMHLPEIADKNLISSLMFHMKHRQSNQFIIIIKI